MSEVTYYFNSWNSNDWWNDPDYMIDNILTNFAYTASGTAALYLDANTCLGTNLGTITKVELRGYAYGDGGDKLKFTPFLVKFFDNYYTIPGIEADWTAYVDITNDTDAPSPWTWANIQDLDCIMGYLSVAKANDLYVAKVEIKVTYTPVAVGQPYTSRVQYVQGMRSWGGF